MRIKGADLKDEFLFQILAAFRRTYNCRCRERPQIAMCFLEWLGRLKWQATGLDASLSFFSTSRRCSRNRSPRLVARHFNLPNHSKKHMAICGLSLHLGTTESRKNLEQKFIFQIGTLNPHGINERFSFN